MTANLGPPGEAGGDPHHQAADHTTCTSHCEVTGRSDCSAVASELRTRRAASQRLPVLESGRSDPWFYDPPIAGYEAAVRHLVDHGLTPAANRDGLRAMWRRGGHHRQAAKMVAECWGLVA